MTDTIKQTTHLLHGYRATSIWSPRHGSRVEWDPDVPRIRQPRKRRRFLEAYFTARREFWTAVATSIGGAVVAVDPDGRTEVIPPATRH